MARPGSRFGTQAVGGAAGPFLLSVIPVLLLLVACERAAGPAPDLNYREPYVDGIMYRIEYYDRSADYFRDVAVRDNDGFRMVPRVRLNRTELSPWHYSPTLYRYGDEEWFRVYRAYNLSVEHYWGEAFSRVVMPGNFEITLPPERYVLERESTLVVSWRPSAGARWYWLDLYCDYDYLDSNGVWDDYVFELDTVVRDTFFIVPRHLVFPGRVVELIEGDGAVAVVAAYGPEVEPGDIGNIRGAGYGFFAAGNEPCDRYFYVGSPPLAKRVRERGTVRERGESLRAVARRVLLAER
ncbi:MAG TPA: hypothetical protein ENN51_02785 [candidate division WOR-3 bacterium]|uniref:DUF4249 family protein n=1 Tax=candidate division WOR-3 bacterium TaxID=2052148 RepID=A0A7V0XEX1_UNCW3|nr:hypothetical protein [candidate division WOR-3 bacterium]